MDKAKVDQGIELLIKRLPERPEWVVIVDRSGLVLPEGLSSGKMNKAP